MKRVLKQQEEGTLIITDWCADYWNVNLYHLLERLRWNVIWRYKDRYPSLLSSFELVGLLRMVGFCDVKCERYRVRVFGIFFWGMQTIRAKKL